MSGRSSPRARNIVSILRRIVERIFVNGFDGMNALSLEGLIHGGNNGGIFVRCSLDVNDVLSPICDLVFSVTVGTTLNEGEDTNGICFVASRFELLPGLRRVSSTIGFNEDLKVGFVVNVRGIRRVCRYCNRRHTEDVLDNFLADFSFHMGSTGSERCVRRLCKGGRVARSCLPVGGDGNLVRGRHRTGIIRS